MQALALVLMSSENGTNYRAGTEVECGSVEGSRAGDRASTGAGLRLGLAIALKLVLELVLALELALAVGHWHWSWLWRSWTQHSRSKQGRLGCMKAISCFRQGKSGG